MIWNVGLKLPRTNITPHLTLLVRKRGAKVFILSEKLFKLNTLTSWCYDKTNIFVDLQFHRVYSFIKSKVFLKQKVWWWQNITLLRLFPALIHHSLLIVVCFVLCLFYWAKFANRKFLITINKLYRAINLASSV